MQPGKSVCCRLRRLPFSLNSTVAGFVLVTILATGVIPFVWAARPGGYESIPARRWSPDEIRALPDGQDRLEKELYRQGEYSRRWNIIHDLVGGQHLSEKSLKDLGSRGLGPALFDKGSGGLQWNAGATAQLDTLSVLIIRIAFENNRDPHLTTIDPSGDFVLDPLTDPKPLEVDPPPRNKAYFESHLDGLSEYYSFMSGGRLHIEGRVLPDESDASYKLTDVADYGPGSGNFWTLEKLEQLVQDIMVKADQETQADGSVNLADYDDNTPGTYIIFVHSGSDWQSDVNGDSPNDIPTFFVTLGESVNLIGTNPEGDPGQLSECSIIPETTNTDGYPGSIAAAFYHEFGHALGLPDVYSTYSGLPAVGIWDLMDSGTNLPVTMGTITAENDTFIISATGVLPPSLSAWNKWFLGWLEMGELDGRDGEYLLPAVGVPQERYWQYPEFSGFDLGDPQAYRAGLSPREWFLLENRWVPVNPGQTPYDDIRFERDEETGVVIYLAGERLGSWENSGLYDYFMPPGGLLVWHVNSDQIEIGLLDNTINSDNEGLKLVEADGIQDIGVLEAYVIGWYGSYLDPFGGSDYEGNPTGFENLYVEGFPSSRNFDRSWSGLTLSEIGPRTQFSSAVMSFKGSNGQVGPGFPYEFPPVTELEALVGGGDVGPRSLSPETLTPVTLAGGTHQVLVFADMAPDDWTGGDYPASLFNRWDDGLRRWTSIPGKPEGAFQALGSPLNGSPFVQDRVDGDGVDLVWGTSAGRVGLTHLPEYTMPAQSWSVELGGQSGTAPVPVNWQESTHRILCTIAPDTLVLLDASGNQLGERMSLQPSGSILVSTIVIGAPITGDGGSDLIPVFTNEGWYLVGQDAGGLTPAPALRAYQRSMADLPLYSAVVTSGDATSVHVFDSAGELGNWEVESGGLVTDLGALFNLDQALVLSPAVADVDGDGSDDLIMATATHILGSKPNGVPLSGFPVRFYDLFPLPDTTRVSGPLVVADGSGDGVNEIYFNTTGGHLIGLDARGKLLYQMPMRWGDRHPGGFAVGDSDEGRLLWMASKGGYTGPPLDRQYVNGRLTAYGLTGASDQGSRTSEWRGPVGDSYRRGSAGEAKSLGPAAPVAADFDKVILYPNPAVSDEVTVRFFSAGSRAARVAVYNIEGEEITRAEIPVAAGTINEHLLPLSGIASGLYLVRLEYDAGNGIEIRTLTLAVEK